MAAAILIILIDQFALTARAGYKPRMLMVSKISGNKDVRDTKTEREL